MYYITAFDDSAYLLWQTKIQHHNFKKQGVDLNKVICLVSYKDKINPSYIEYSKKVPVSFVFYEDEIPNRIYVPSIRPNLLKRFFRDNPAMESEYILIHDSDVTIVNPPLYEGMKDGLMHLADTISYIGHNYLATCGEEVYDKMLEFFPGLTKELLKQKDKVSGGAQYFGKGHTAAMWEYIELKTNLLYLYVIQVETEGKKAFKESGSFPHTNNVQAWTAGMWAELWGFWLHGIDTMVDEQLNFTTGAHKLSEVSNRNFYHNAGVVSTNADIRFYKQNYANVDVFKEDYSFIQENEATLYYIKELKETGEWLLTL